MKQDDDDRDIARWLAAEYMWLKREMRQVLAELELTSNGVTSAPRLTVAAVAPRAGDRVPSSTPSFESSAPVSGDAYPPHLHYRWMWNQAETNDDRRHALDQARAKLRQLRISPPPGEGESIDDRNRRMLDDHEDFAAKDVAIAMRMSETEVRKVRMANGRDPELGTPTIAHKLGPNASPVERAKHAVYLNEKHGLGPRAIAPLLGVTARQACRYLRTGRRAA